jgi:hypothetical protein
MSHEVGHVCATQAVGFTRPIFVFERETFVTVKGIINELLK